MSKSVKKNKPTVSSENSTQELLSAYFSFENVHSKLKLWPNPKHFHSNVHVAS